MENMEVDETEEPKRLIRSSRASELNEVVKKNPACFKKFYNDLKLGVANDLQYYLEIENLSPGDKEAAFEVLLLRKRKEMLEKNETPSESQFLKKYPQFRTVIKDVFIRGVRFGNAVATGFLSEGGMGDIYLGYLPFGKVRKKCAIKVTRQDCIEKHYQSIGLARAESFFEYRKKIESRFERELEVTAFVSDNRQSVQAYSAGSFQSSANREEKYLLMEYVAGLNLLELKKRYKDEFGKNLPSGAICEIIAQVAEGLSHLHVKIIHRDIKPQNIMVVFKKNSGLNIHDGKDLIRILDFGIARVLEDTAESIDMGIQTNYSSLLGVNSNNYMGTPHYSPYEQFQDSSHVGQSSDLYALGCTMYQLLNEKNLPPFPLELKNEQDFLKLREAHLATPVPEIKRSDCGRIIKRILQKVMHKQEAKRYQSAFELLEDLQLVRKPIELQNVINRLNGKEDVIETKHPSTIINLLNWNPFKKKE